MKTRTCMTNLQYGKQYVRKSQKNHEKHLLPVKINGYAYELMMLNKQIVNGSFNISLLNIGLRTQHITFRGNQSRIHHKVWKIHLLSYSINIILISWVHISQITHRIISSSTRNAHIIFSKNNILLFPLFSFTRTLRIHTSIHITIIIISMLGHWFWLFFVVSFFHLAKKGVM